VKLIVPKLFDELIKISRIPIMGGGYGNWNPENFNAKYPSGKDWALAKLMPEHWLEIHKTEDYFNLELMDSIAKEVESLVKYIPEQRYMVHGDLGFSNTLSDGREITGVIDWAECMYGDFVYDLCWLQFWSDKIDYLGMFPKYSGGLPLENYMERSRLYLLIIALESMVIFAESGRKDEYLDCERRLKEL
jgi:hygromycin-B 4-O-kinase